MSTNDSDHTLLSKSPVAQEAPELPQGSEIDRYVVLEVLGKGGMGIVYKAYDPQLNRGVALKLIRARQQDSRGEGSSGSARLLREAQALAQLNHPNIVSVHDVGTVEDNVFVAMELVPGKTLRAWRKATKPSTREVLEVMRAAGQGLAAAHKAGLIHRDFKPDNVIVGEDGRVRVIDFGLARAGAAQPSAAIDDHKDLEEIEAAETQVSDKEELPVDDSRETPLRSSSQDLLSSPLTRVGSVMGTPMYMAPEQHLGARVDARADQFSFCVVLYEVLYGKRAFSGGSLKEIAKQARYAKVRPPPAESDVPKWLQGVVMRGLSMRPGARFPSMEELLDELSEDPQEVRRQQRAVRRRKLFVIGSVVLAVVVPVAVSYEITLRRSQMCTGAGAYVEEVWDPEAKEKVREAFIGTKVSHARDTATRVVLTLDAYVASWRKMFTESCRATRVSGEQSVEIMDLRMRCMRSRLTEVGELTRIFTQADASVVARATQAAASLSTIAGCADAEALLTPRQRIKQPPDQATAEKVDAIRERLLRVKSLENTGKYVEGSELVAVVLSEAKALDYLPLTAEALYWTGRIQERLARYEEAAETLETAYKSAAATHHDALVQQSTIWLIWTVGYQLARHEDGLEWGRFAEYAEHTPAVDDQARARRPHAIGILFDQLGDYEMALRYYRESLAIKQKALGSEHPDVARVLSNIGIVFHLQGKFDEALKHHRMAQRSLEETLGPGHPDVARGLDAMGATLLRLRRYDEALQCEHRALAIWETAVGPAHPALAESLTVLGAGLVDTGRHHEALEPLERLASICAGATCVQEAHGMGLFSLARALVATDGDTARGIRLAKRAREVFRKTRKRFARELEVANAWLRDRGIE